MSSVTAGDWTGVFPAVTTQFASDESIDAEANQAHVRTLVEAGVDGLIMLGTLGEATTMEPEEKREVIRATLETVAGRVPVLAGVAEFSTRAACRFAEDMQALGCSGLMVLPAMVYRADAAEAMAHFRAVARASDLPVMVYNNPVTYGVDVTPEMFAELADEETLVAIKESSDDPRRITDIVNQVGERYTLFCGVDDLALETAMLGTTGWVAGLVNAFPEESVRLWRLIHQERWEEARTLYRWFTPLLHLDVHIKLVQYIKLAQALCGHGTETVRAPRRKLEGAERERVIGIVQAGLDARPKLAAE
ncbi:MAG: dihydrodipicolinate synthase family protein [Tistlia sp.]|uniref:dihydrodipicolinate synthase family protein n=1 Tax=Tistlia sp. TaxID=3057121 RepID=UPI0034A5CB5C